MDGLFAPPPPLKPHLRPYRFWIWLQLILLRLYVRRLKGRGTPFLTMCDARGNVWIAAIGDAPGERAPQADGPGLPEFVPSRAFRIAMGAPADRPACAQPGPAALACMTGAAIHGPLRPCPAPATLPRPDT